MLKTHLSYRDTFVKGKNPCFFTSDQTDKIFKNLEFIYKIYFGTEQVLQANLRVLSMPAYGDGINEAQRRLSNFNTLLTTPSFIKLLKEEHSILLGDKISNEDREISSNLEQPALAALYVILDESLSLLETLKTASIHASLDTTGTFDQKWLVTAIVGLAALKRQFEVGLEPSATL